MTLPTRALSVSARRLPLAQSDEIVIGPLMTFADVLKTMQLLRENDPMLCRRFTNEMVMPLGRSTHDPDIRDWAKARRRSARMHAILDRLNELASLLFPVSFDR